MRPSLSRNEKRLKNECVILGTVIFLFLMTASLKAQFFTVGGSYAMGGSSNARVAADFDGDLDIVSALRIRFISI